MAVIVNAPLELLRQWIRARATPDARTWFDGQIASLAAEPTDKRIYIALGYATRRLGKSDLSLDASALAAARAARPGWDPSDWSIDQAARIAFVLAMPHGSDAQFAERLEKLFVTADIGELITFYRGLPLYPSPSLHLMRAREGMRSAMQPIYEAVAHRNPYPREMFDEGAWNHLVLKAVFIGAQLHPIDGLDARANPNLMSMLCDYARERRAAGRQIAPQLWRCVGPFADDAAIDLLTAVLSTGGCKDRRAAALALAAAKVARARAVLNDYPELAAKVGSGEISWSLMDAD